jgi:hypothetical protein
VLRRFRRAEEEFSLLEIQPATGPQAPDSDSSRAHWPCDRGDKLYGPDENIYLDFVSYRLTDAQRQRLILPHHALHAAEVRFEWRGEERRFAARAEEWFSEFMYDHLGMH